MNRARWKNHPYPFRVSIRVRARVRGRKHDRSFVCCLRSRPKRMPKLRRRWIRTAAGQDGVACPTGCYDFFGQNVRPPAKGVRVSDRFSFCRFSACCAVEVTDRSHTAKAKMSHQTSLTREICWPCRAPPQWQEHRHHHHPQHIIINTIDKYDDIRGVDRKTFGYRCALTFPTRFWRRFAKFSARAAEAAGGMQRARDCGRWLRCCSVPSSTSAPMSGSGFNSAHKSEVTPDDAGLVVMVHPAMRSVYAALYFRKDFLR